jgi:hypothetical protein
MPGFCTESGLLGLAAFPVIKFTGYSLAGRFLKHRYEDPGVSSAKFGAARTALGVIAGICYSYSVGLEFPDHLTMILEPMINY